jgi:hypothetical protein
VSRIDALSERAVQRAMLPYSAIPDVWCQWIRPEVCLNTGFQ